MENNKRPASLAVGVDFTKPLNVRGAFQPAPSLVTPVLALSTPDLNKMISEGELAVLTPNGISSVIPPQTNNVPPSPLIPTTVNSNNIINSNNNNICNNNTGNSMNGNTNLSNQNNITNGQKRTDNSVIVSNLNHIGGNNNNNNKQIRDQDIEKIEKKRERNRLAAKKCRQRKLETIDELRKEVSDWQKKYERLEMDFERYKSLRNKEIEQLTKDIAELKSLIRQ